MEQKKNQVKTSHTVWAFHIGGPCYVQRVNVRRNVKSVTFKVLYGVAFSVNRGRNAWPAAHAPMLLEHWNCPIFNLFLHYHSSVNYRLHMEKSQVSCAPTLHEVQWCRCRIHRIQGFQRWSVVNSQGDPQSCGNREQDCKRRYIKPREWSARQNLIFKVKKDVRID